MLGQLTGAAFPVDGSGGPTGAGWLLPHAVVIANVVAANRSIKVCMGLTIANAVVVVV